MDNSKTISIIYVFLVNLHAINVKLLIYVSTVFLTIFFKMIILVRIIIVNQDNI